MLRTMHTKYGEYELNVIGNPAKLLIVPIKFYYGITISLQSSIDCSSIDDVHEGDVISPTEGVSQ